MSKNPTKPIKQPKLTRKQQAFVKHLIDNPKASATQAVKATYGKPDKPVTESTARNIASENLTKPNIQLELAKHSNTAESVLLEVMNYSKELGKTGNSAGASYASVASANARDILDRVHGKARQQVDVTTTGITLNIDLTTALDVDDTTE